MEAKSFFIVVLLFFSVANGQPKARENQSACINKLWSDELKVRGAEEANDLEEVVAVCDVIEKKSDKEEPCIFPFKYANTTYFACSTADNDDKPWCSTKVDADSEYVGDGHWGDCKITELCTVQTNDTFQNLTTSLEVQDLMLNPALTIKYEREREERSVSFTDESYCSASINKFSKTGEVTETLEMCTLNEFGLKPKSDAGPIDCKCVPFGECDWSQKVFSKWSLHVKLTHQQLGETKLKHQQIVSAGKSFFTGRLCGKKNVICCNDKPDSKNFFDYPTTEQLKNSCTETESAQKKENPKNSGKWKPNRDNSECGIPVSTTYQKSGKIAKVGEFPFLALLEDSNGELKCSGSLINKRYVLTAAHCITPDLSNVILGEYNLAKDPDCKKKNGIEICTPRKIIRNIEKTIVHESYANDPAYDIALIRLDELVPLFNEDSVKSHVTLVCLPWFDNYRKKRSPEYDDEDYNEDVLDFVGEGFVKGWGLVTNLKLTKSAQKIMRKEKMKITEENCPSAVQTDIQFCASTEQRQKKGRKVIGKVLKDSCVGDSGGPLVYKEVPSDPWTQGAIRSDPPSTDCKNQKVGIYTKVSPFLEWIESKLEE